MMKSILLVLASMLFANTVFADTPAATPAVAEAQQRVDAKFAELQGRVQLLETLKANPADIAAIKGFIEKLKSQSLDGEAFVEKVKTLDIAFQAAFMNIGKRVEVLEVKVGALEKRADANDVKNAEQDRHLVALDGQVAQNTADIKVVSESVAKMAGSVSAMADKVNVVTNQQVFAGNRGISNEYGRSNVSRVGQVFTVNGRPARYTSETEYSYLSDDECSCYQESCQSGRQVVCQSTGYGFDGGCSFQPSIACTWQQSGRQSVASNNWSHNQGGHQNQTKPDVNNIYVSATATTGAITNDNKNTNGAVSGSSSNSAATNNNASTNANNNALGVGAPAVVTNPQAGAQSTGSAPRVGGVGRSGPQGGTPTSRSASGSSGGRSFGGNVGRSAGGRGR